MGLRSRLAYLLIHMQSTNLVRMTFEIELPVAILAFAAVTVLLLSDSILMSWPVCDSLANLLLCKSFMANSAHVSSLSLVGLQLLYHTDRDFTIFISSCRRSRSHGDALDYDSEI